jgi:predicted permease
MNSYVYLIKQAWASLLLKKEFSATVIITMGITTGALICVITLAYLIFFQPLPYPDHERLYHVSHILDDNQGKFRRDLYTYPSAIQLHKNREVFDETAMKRGAFETLTSLPTQPQIPAAYVTPGWFKLTGAKMARGRFFEETEALNTYNPVAVITYKTWMNDFNGREDILQQRMTLIDTNYRIIGVLSQDYAEPQTSIYTRGFDTGIWLPWDFNPDAANKENWRAINGYISLIGKVKPDMRKTEVEQTLTSQINIAWTSNVNGIPDYQGWSVDIELQHLKDMINSNSQQTIVLLMFGVIGLALIACTNIANLFAARAAQQQKNLALHAVLGARKSHLFRHLLSESGLLMFLSLLVALAVSSWGFHLIQTQFARIFPRVSELSLNNVTLLAAVLSASLFAVFFAVASVKMLKYRLLNTALKNSGKGTGIQISRRFRQGLIVIQVAIASLLVFTNLSLFSKALGAIEKPLGFDVDNMISITVGVSASHQPTQEELKSALALLKQKLSNLPQVESVSQADEPLTGFGFIPMTDVLTEQSFRPELKSVDAEYFKQINQPLVAGNYMNDSDVKDGVKHVLVNDIFASVLNLEHDVIGSTLTVRNEQYTVIGIVKHVIHPLYQDEINNRVYFPASPTLPRINIKLNPNQSLSREQIVSTIKQSGSSYFLAMFRDLPKTKVQQLFSHYVTTFSTAIIAGMTIFIASIGLYGMISFGTRARRLEIGTRMAIGANRKSLIKLIIWDNADVIFTGMLTSVVMLGAISVAQRDVMTLLLGANIIPSFVMTISLIGALSLFACYWSLRRYINKPAIYALRENS